MFHRTTTIADAILALLEYEHDHMDVIDANKHISVEPYKNGRERGWSLRNTETRRQVSFSENRNSDDIVVYHGRMFTDFPDNNLPTEETWKQAKYFAQDKIVDAVKFIIKSLEMKGGKNA